jgi:hypothetical protein
MYVIYIGIKKILPQTIFTIPTVVRSDVSLQLPTTTNITISNHGPPPVEMAPKHPT